MTNPVTSSVYGYYTVGDQYYLNKTEALYAATKTRLPVTWHFHNDTFSKLNWAKRPEGSLREVYKQRAQQIRDEYDHVIVYFSGGMDSYTILHSFLSNNIHIDEIVTLFPRRAERSVWDLRSNTDQSNLGSEYEFAVLPVLKHIAKCYPAVNIVVDDFSDALEKELVEADIANSNSWQSLFSYTKFCRRTEKEILALNQNKRIAVVTGAEKTHLLFKDGNCYGFFRDQANGAELVGRSVEFFYWSPNFPIIPVLQAHCLLEFIKNDLSINPSATPDKPYDLDDKREVYRQACYADYDKNTFQVNKYGGTWAWPSDKWIKQYNPTYFASWEWVNSQYFNSIDDKFIKKQSIGGGMGFSFFDSPYYLVESNTGLPDFAF